MAGPVSHLTKPPAQKFLSYNGLWAAMHTPALVRIGKHCRRSYPTLCRIFKKAAHPELARRRVSAHKKPGASTS